MLLFSIICEILIAHYKLIKEHLPRVFYLDAGSIGGETKAATESETRELSPTVMKQINNTISLTTNSNCDSKCQNGTTTIAPPMVTKEFISHKNPKFMLTPEKPW